MTSFQVELLEARAREREHDMRVLIDIMRQFALEVQRLRLYEDAWRREHGNESPDASTKPRDKDNKRTVEGRKVKKQSNQRR